MKTKIFISLLITFFSVFSYAEPKKMVTTIQIPDTSANGDLTINTLQYESTHAENMEIESPEEVNFYSIWGLAITDNVRKKTNIVPIGFFSQESCEVAGKKLTGIVAKTLRESRKWKCGEILVPTS